ncbi:MAG: hypothetical protein ACO3RU_13620 [Planctomycetota bacterium]
MTGAEREDFRELRQEMRDGFKEVTSLVATVAKRVNTLENRALAEDAVAKDVDRRKIDQRWRLSLLVGVAASIFVSLLNFLTRVT